MVSELRGPNYTKSGKGIDLSLVLSRFVLDFQKRATQRRLWLKIEAIFLTFSPPCKIRRGIGEVFECHIFNWNLGLDIWYTFGDGPPRWLEVERSRRKKWKHNGKIWGLQLTLSGVIKLLAHHVDVGDSKSVAIVSNYTGIYRFRNLRITDRKRRAISSTLCVGLRVT